jgi:cytochrome c5
MVRSFGSLARAAAIAAGVVLCGASLGAEAAPSAPASEVSVDGVTLRSVAVDLPDSGRMFGGAGADVVNANCLTCHSAGMVLTQPQLSRAAWEAEVEKMRKTFKAPVEEKDVAGIVDYLASLPR